MLTFATKKLSTVTGANGQKAEAEFPFCPRSFDRAVMAWFRVTAPMYRFNRIWNNEKLGNSWLLRIMAK